MIQMLCMRRTHRYYSIRKIHIIRKINCGIRYEPVLRPSLSSSYRGLTCHVNNWKWGHGRKKYPAPLLLRTDFINSYSLFTLCRTLAWNRQLFPKTLFPSKRQDPAEPEMKSEWRKRRKEREKAKEGRKESFRLIALSTRSQDEKENPENSQVAFLWLTLYCTVLAVNICCLVCLTYKSNDGDFVYLLISDRDGEDVTAPKPTNQIKQTELLFKKSLVTLLFELLSCLQSALRTCYGSRSRRPW